MNYLKTKIKESKMTQKELATRCGLTANAIGYYCMGKNKKAMPLDLATNIAIILDIPIEEFVKGVLKNEV